MWKRGWRGGEPLVFDIIVYLFICKHTIFLFPSVNIWLEIIPLVMQAAAENICF